MAGDREILQVIDEIFEYPTNGVDDWGEEGTAWAVAVTEALARLIGPQDILITEIPILEGQTDAAINGLNFDTAVIQAILVEGFITRTYTDATPTEVDRFTLKGAYNGSDFFFDDSYSGNDAGVTIGIQSSGQGVYTSETRTNTDTIIMKFEAKAIIDDGTD